MKSEERKHRRNNRKEKAFLAVARNMLQTNGFNGITMEKVAEAADYSRATIYNHFSSKEDLILALALENLNLRTELLEKAAKFDGNHRERMCAVGEVSILVYPLQTRTEMVLYSSEFKSRATDPRRKALRKAEIKNYNIPVQVVKDAVRDGDLKLPRAMGPEELVFTLHSITFGSSVLLNTYGPVADFKVQRPLNSIRHAVHAIMDGLEWRPLSTEMDYKMTLERIKAEIFPPPSNPFEQIISL